LIELPSAMRCWPIGWWFFRPVSFRLPPSDFVSSFQPDLHVIFSRPIWSELVFN
jgi:hypothetical protein